MLFEVALLAPEGPPPPGILTGEPSDRRDVDLSERSLDTTKNATSDAHSTQNHPSTNGDLLDVVLTRAGGTWRISSDFMNIENQENNQAYEGRVDGGRSAGQDEGPMVAALPVGTLVEVYWPGERSWYGGRLRGEASVEGATVIEYLDGNPEREEVFLEDRPRGPGEHDGFLSRRGGGRRVAVRTVDSWSREAEKGLLVGWRRLSWGDGGCAVADAGASADAGVVSSEEGMKGPHLSLRLELSGRSEGEGADLGDGSVASGHAGGGEAMGMAGAGAARRRGLEVDPDGLGEAGWTWLRGLSVDECVVSDFPSLMVPKKLWGLFTECVMVALWRMRLDTEVFEACKLFFLLPRLVLQPVQQGVKQGVAQVIKERRARFLRGEWEGMHAEVPGDRRAVAEVDEERVLRDTVRLVKAGQLGKAAKRLELAKLAPATEETLLKLERLHPAGTGRRQDVGEDRRRELREQALELDEKT
ncbi:hypothetical protein CYMTET_27946 [Cymbomonas tetramitiformis]|uniref:Tudor domain-containing protein n=1 Tax=Cymbomonas tetramitiformis TaxID=36881 RepID=A0AAE0KWN5_9CHLO|nr:hypothetical protein CYMTET_27946 [Cymbomonas tetramitiformis]